MSGAAPEPFRSDGDWAELCTCFSGVPAEVERHHPMLLGEMLELRVPEMLVAGPAMDEDEGRLALPLRAIVDRRAVGGKRGPLGGKGGR